MYVMPRSMALFRRATAFLRSAWLPTATVPRPRIGTLTPVLPSVRGPDVAGARVLERRPAALVVRLDGRLFFGQRPLEADVTVDVAVGEVVDDLPDGPVPIAGVELLLRQIGDGAAQGGWCLLD